MPAGWAGDPQGGVARARKIPPEVTFATKPALAGQIVTRAVRRGPAPARWVAGDVGCTAPTPGVAGAPSARCDWDT